MEDLQILVGNQTEPEEGSYGQKLNDFLDQIHDIFRQFYSQAIYLEDGKTPWDSEIVKNAKQVHGRGSIRSSISGGIQVPKPPEE